MKTNILKKAAGAFTVLLCLAAGLNAKAQISNPYQVRNDLPVCSVVITYKISNGGVNCTNNCSSGGPITIGPGSTIANIPIPAGCTPACNIAITIIQVGSTTLGTPLVADKNTPTPSGPCGCGTCISPTGGPIQMSWLAGLTKIF